MMCMDQGAMSESNEIRIVGFNAERHAAAFAELNLVWIEEYFEVEQWDERVLYNPVREIIEPGGAILVAEDEGGEVVGVCGLRYEGPGRYEVTKMAVTDKMQGKGIGRRLLEAVIEHARGLGAKELFIISNTVLEAAIHLYRSGGFVEVESRQTEYARGNIELLLKVRK